MSSPAPLSRRGFLATGLAALAGPVSTAQAPPWKIGLGLNGFMSSSQRYKKTYPIWEVLHFAANEGFDGIELVDGWPMGQYPTPDEFDRVKALKRLYDRYGLAIYTFQTGSADAHAADPDRRKRWLDEFASYVRLAKLLQADFIGHWPGGGLEGNETVEQAIEHLAQSYRTAAQLASIEGRYLSFEIEPPFIFNTLEHLQQILAAADHPACKTNYDPSHFDLMSGSTGKPEVMLEKLGVKHIGHVHLTDTDGTLFEGTSKHLPCGEGHCDIPASLRVLRDGGYTGWIMVDAWMIDDVYHAARAGKAAIRSASPSSRN